MGPGQRALAAIVFTDVVSFSARMQRQEVKTLELLERDFAAMRKICDKYSGSVLKTTGDGLLLYFTSAVHAVACALKIQKHLAEKARALPPDEVLTHRIGIHLGDVVVNDQDVMGDGVNIASRLQAEAEPGGICISQTVYDVVKNKLALSATRLGPRELKNISDAVPVYHLLLEAQAMGAQEADPHPAEPDKPASAAPAAALSLEKSPKGPSLVLSGVLLAVLLVLVAFFAVRVYRTSERDKSEEAAAQAAFGSLLADPAAGGAAGPRQIARAAREWREELAAARSRLADDYDFAEMARSIRDPRTAPANPADAALREQIVRRLQGLFGWTATALQRYSREKPLVVRELAGTAPKEIRVYAGPDRRLYFTEGGAIRQRGWADQKPSVLGAIIAGAILEARPVPPREAVQGAQIFAYFYGLPELNAALRRGRPGGK
jgi:class 3 adenylate cyclase